VSTRSIEIEAQLIERAVERRNALIAQAKKRAESIMRSAEEEVESIKAESEKQVLSMVGSELRAVSDRIVGRAQLEGRKLLMESRQELLSMVFEEAEKRLREIAEEKGADYGVILWKIIVEAATAMGGDEFIVAANERDLAYLEKNLGKINNQVKKALGGGAVTLDKDPIDVMGGVVVRNSDGTKTYYNTLEGRLASVRARIEAEVAKVLGVI
jgi:vacuolar-type H+-ATPase subunit E/Vma4